MSRVRTSFFVIPSLLFLLGCASLKNEAMDKAAGNPVPGTAMLKGKVTAPQAFQAAKVYARHLDKNILYMVYTGEGSYQTVAMFPGNYEVWAEKTGFESDRNTIQIEADEELNVNISLREAAP